MSAHDASVNVLMDRMAAMEKQRRVLRMRRKELEAKVSFATTEKADLTLAAQRMNEEEEQLKADLELLAREEQQLDVRGMEVADTLRRTEEEETVQMAAVAAEVQSLEKDKAAWLEKTAELETLRRTWEEDPVTSTCIAALRAEMAKLNALTADKAALEQRRTELESELERMRAEQQARLACAGSAATVAGVASLPSPPAADQKGGTSPLSSASASAAPNAVAAQNVDEEMKRVEYEWAQVTARHNWTMSSLRREVDALSSRATELRELLASVQATRLELFTRAAQLQQCLTSSLCPQCAPPESQV